MIDYNKTDIKESLHLDQIFELLTDWGGEPEYTSFGILSATICHNEPGEGSRKLYFYENSGLFQCYTGCQGFFDVFELVIKVAEIQWKQDFDLNDAVRWIARRFGLSGKAIDEPDEDAIEEAYANDEVLYGGISEMGAILVSATMPSEGPVLKAVKGTGAGSMPDGQFAIKFQVVAV